MIVGRDVWTRTVPLDMLALSVCDALVLKALEALGKYVVRADRSRFKVLGDRPWHVAHTLWPPDDRLVSKALRSAWAVVPASVALRALPVEPARLALVLDEYVHDLAVTGTPHRPEELRLRLAVRLGIGAPAGERAGRD